MSKQSFIAGVTAIVQGDNPEVLGTKIYKVAVASVKSQIAALEAATIQLEENVDDAKEALKLARYNQGQKISDRDAYVSSLLAAKNKVAKAEEALELHEAKITFFEEELSAIESEDSEPVATETE